MSDEQEFADFLARAERELLPKMQDSDMVISLVESDVDIKFAVELGLAIMLDKPIMVVARPGKRLPKKLRLVADHVARTDYEDGSMDAVMADIQTFRTKVKDQGGNNAEGPAGQTE